MGPMIEGGDDEPRDDELDLRDASSDVGADADVNERDLVGADSGDVLALDEEEHPSTLSGSQDASASGSTSEGDRARSRERVHDSVDDLGSIPDDTPSVQVSISLLSSLEKKKKKKTRNI